jgi:hypothetical protein
MAAEQAGFFVRGAPGSRTERSRVVASQSEALGVLNSQSRYGVKPGTAIVRIAQGREDVVLEDNALVIALMRWRTKNPGRQ